MKKIDMIDRMITLDPALEAEHADDIPYRKDCNYLTDHNAAQRVLKKVLTYKSASTYWRILHEITYPKGQHAQVCPTLNNIIATPVQKCEAILKLTKLWVEL